MGGGRFRQGETRQEGEEGETGDLSLVSVLKAGGEPTPPWRWNARRAAFSRKC